MSSRDFYASNSGIAPPNSFIRKTTVQQSVEEETPTSEQSGTEPQSEELGEGTVDAPHDAGNAPEQPLSPSHKPIDDSIESPSTTHQGSGNPEATPSPAQTQKIIESKEKSEAAQFSSPKGSPRSKKSTGVAASGGDFDAAKKGAGKEAGRLRNLERDRDVSPGTLDDGTHAITSGDRGESYEPSAMSKLKNMFHK